MRELRPNELRPITAEEAREMAEVLKEAKIKPLHELVQHPELPQRAAPPTAGNVVQTEIERRWEATRKHNEKPVKHPGREAYGPRGWMQ